MNGYIFTGIYTQGTIRPLPQVDCIAYLCLERVNEKWVYQNITIIEQLPTIVTTKQNGEISAVFDGSFDLDYGTVIWYIDDNVTIKWGLNIVLIGSDIVDVTGY